jgi:RNA polymerase sigma-70 factor (ECF subfamily)
LLASVGHYLANERDRARAEKRGGDRPLLSLDIESEEARYLVEPETSVTPEQIFERRWALTLLETALEALREAYEAKGRGYLFAQLKPLLTSEGDESYRRTADLLATTEGAVKQQVYRLRQRYRKLIRDLVAQTVAAPEEVDDELRQIKRALEQ